MAVTVLEIITGAYELLGVTQENAPLSPYLATMGLRRLNEMVNRWAADRLTIYGIPEQDFTLVAGQREYTIGPTGDFAVARPEWIDRASLIIINTPNPSQPLERPMYQMTLQEWQHIGVKATQSQIPTAFYYDRSGFPDGIIKLWPTPSTEENTFRLYLPTAVTEFATYTEEIALPPGYREALEYNLALRLADPVGRTPVPATITMIATQSLEQIKSVNVAANATELVIDPALRGGRGYGYSWLDDTWGPF